MKMDKAVLDCEENIGEYYVGMYETFQVASPKQRWLAAGLVVKCALSCAGAKYGPTGTILEALGKVHRVQLMHGVATNKLLRCRRATRGLLR